MTTTRIYPPLILQLVPFTGVMRTLLCLVLGVSFTALLAQLRLEIGPVPLTGQTLAVLLIGAAYGARLGTLTMVSYLALGALGAPVFAGLSGGAAALTGATAGYLAGFVLAAAAVGALAERGWDRAFSRAAMAMLLGNLLIYLPGLAWLRQLLPDWPTTLSVGLIPFIVGDAIKLLLAAMLLPVAWKLIGKA